MSQSDKTDNLHNRRISDQTRLESWKAIANYLHRSVRTVRRWEGDQGLPIHRHKHASGSSVHAYCSELDAWRNRHKQSIQQEPQAARMKLPPLRTAAAYLLIALAGGLVGIVAGRFTVQDVPYQANEIAERKAWVLIAAPVNHDGYRDIGDSLRAALIREIGTSSYPALPQQRIQETLLLMRRDPKTALSPDLAREIALRDGDVRALLIPRLEQLGESFVVSVEVVDPVTDQLIAYPSEQVAALGAILPAYEKLATTITAELSLIPDALSLPDLPRVTTRSLSALNLYAQALDDFINDKPLVAYELLILALVEDPEFASALALKAWTLERQGAAKEDYVRAANEARELKTSITAAERYFIDGTYRHLSGDRVRADASYRALLGIMPDHFLGAQAILELCREMGQAAGCAPHSIRLADNNPLNFEYNIQAAWALAADLGNVDQAATYAERAMQAWRNSDRDFDSGSIARAHVFPVMHAWSNGDVTTAVRESERLTEVLPTLDIDTRNNLIAYLVEFSSVAGRIDEAKVLLESISDPAMRDEVRAGFLFASGQKEALRNHLSSDTEFEQQASALFMAIAGLPDHAKAMHDDLRLAGMNDAKAAVIRARIAFGDGSMATAQSELENAVVDLTLNDRGFYFVGHDLLAAVHKAGGQLDEAIRVLEKTTATREDAAFNNAGIYWMMCQRKLAMLYRDTGRTDKAELIENKLRELLLMADSDFPLLASLKDV